MDKSIQNNNLLIELSTISPHLFWIIPILEVLAVPLVVLLHLRASAEAPKAPWHGWLAGMVATAGLLLILNRFLPRMHFHIQGQRLIRIPIAMASLWGGFFLAGIFAVQRILPVSMLANYWADGAAKGFVSLVVPTLVIGTMYAIAARWMPFASITLIADAPMRLRGLRWLPLSLCLGIYEGVAFPLINLWQSMPDHQILWGAFWGGIGGLAGIIATISLYSLLPPLRLHLSGLDQGSK